MKTCSCGSGLARKEHKDARGIFLTFACLKCEKVKLAVYRPEVLTDPNYWADEDIDSEPFKSSADRVDGYDRDDLGESPDY